MLKLKIICIYFYVKIKLNTNCINDDQKIGSIFGGDIMFLKKILKNSIFITLWILILFDAICAGFEFSETIDISKNVFEKMIVYRTILYSIYIIFTFLFRKTMSEFFLVMNTALWFFMSISPILNSTLIYKNIVIFDRISLVFNIIIVIFIFSVYIKTFHSNKIAQ